MVIRYNYSSSPSVYLSNNISGLKNANFVDTVLQDLLHRDLIVKCKKHLLFLSITVFSQSNKKKAKLISNANIEDLSLICCRAVRMSSNFTFCFHKCSLTALRSRMNLFFLFDWLKTVMDKNKRCFLHLTIKSLCNKSCKTVSTKLAFFKLT
jgi:hypothetical protein